MAFLYQLKRSPFMSRDLEHVLDIAQRGSHIMLYQDAVLMAADTPENRQWLASISERGVKVHALREDLRARGLNDPLEWVDLVDYSGWVDLVEQYVPMSW
jgi:tRNA 2-thiouridine synthesizing protein B